MSWCSSGSNTASVASKRSTMIPHANAARSAPPVNLWALRAIKGLIGALALSVAAQYLAGYLFLYWIHADPKAATPMTIARYAYYYGSRPDIHGKLWVSSAGGLSLLLVP